MIFLSMVLLLAVDIYPLLGLNRYGISSNGTRPFHLKPFLENTSDNYNSKEVYGTVANVRTFVARSAEDGQHIVVFLVHLIKVE